MKKQKQTKINLSPQTSAEKWYQGRINGSGKKILGFVNVILGVIFFVTALFYRDIIFFLVGTIFLNTAFDCYERNIGYRLHRRQQEEIENLKKRNLTKKHSE